MASSRAFDHIAVFSNDLLALTPSSHEDLSHLFSRENRQELDGVPSVMCFVARRVSPDTAGALELPSVGYIALLAFRRVPLR